MLEVIQQTAWGHFLMTFLSFAILLAIIFHFTWKPLKKVLDDRAEKIENEAAQAEISRKQNEELKNQMVHEKREMQAQLAEEKKRMKKEMDSKRIAMEEEVSVELANEREEAQKQIEADRRQMLHDMKDQMARLSVNIAEEIIKRQVQVSDHQALVDELQREMEEKSHDEN